MNKLMGIPLTIMLLLSLMSLAMGATLNHGEVKLQADDSGPAWYEIWDSQWWSGDNIKNRWSFDIWGVQGAYIILIAAIAVGTVAGFNLLGSGFSPFSQRLLFSAISYLGLWACLSVISNEFMDIGAFGMGFLLWIVLTIMFLVGFVSDVNASGD